MSLDVRQQGHPIYAVPRNEHLVALKEPFESGQPTPVIDRKYGLSEAAEAMRNLDEGHTRGKLVVTVEHSG